MKIEFIVFNGGSINYYCYSASYRQIREQRMIASNGFECIYFLCLKQKRDEN